MGNADSYCGILLAAGRSTRFGGDKLLHPLPDSTPIALASAKAMLRALPRLIAVVDRSNLKLVDLFEKSGIGMVAALIDNAGIGSSLAAGVAAAPEASGWVVALADMPFIRPQSISLVLDRLAAGAILTAPVYRGQRGHPVGFAGEFRAELLRLGGDEGAREILRRYRDQLDVIECDDPGTIMDIDRPDDLARLTAGLNPPG